MTPAPQPIPGEIARDLRGHLACRGFTAMPAAPACSGFTDQLGEVG